MNRDHIRFPAQHERLRTDIHVLGDALGEVLREQGGDELFNLVELDRHTAIDWRASGTTDAEALAVRVRGRPPQLARELVRAFSSWFQLVNVAEKVHRIRRRHEYFNQEAAAPQPGGMSDALGSLKDQGVSLSEVSQLLRQISIEPVFTAHPLESARRTTLRRQQRLAAMLLEYGDTQLAPHEHRTLLSRVRAEITTEWQTAEHPRERLTVADEREHAVFYLAEVLYQIVPAFYLELRATLARLYATDADQVEVPIILRFGSWVGGDMDGVPDVHAKSIRETLVRLQRVILNNYFEECQRLAEHLSQSDSRVKVSAEVLRRLDAYRLRFPGAAGVAPARHDLMPYRMLLGLIAERLRSTYDGRANGYERAAQFRDDIALIAASLRDNAGRHAGLVPMMRLLWRVDTFGFHLATLDVRQHARVHHEVLAQGLDDPQWLTRTPRDRCRRLLDLLERDAGPTGAFNALGKRTLAVFEAMMQGRHRFGEPAIGLYIVSGADTADDVLAPLLLARWAEAVDGRSGEVALDIAPEFDSVHTLGNCADTLRQLLGETVYRRHLEARGRLQTVLLGYSESNLEGGIVASRLAAYRAQRGLSKALRGARDAHVLFHARGGSTPRGGGPIDTLLRASPAESISGVLRFTEQGEAISQNYGLSQNAMRTLERAFGALAQATLAVRRGVAVQEGSAMAECAALVASSSHNAWRQLTRGEERFFEFFSAVTPIDVIERMLIGSHQQRAGTQGMDRIQPAAWVYAWAQSRHTLPGWYGAGSGMASARDQFSLEQLRRCYRGWPFFRYLIDDIEAMLARTDLSIAAHYDLLAPPELRSYARLIQAEYESTRALVLDVKESAELLDTDLTLQRAIALRNPYVDPMSLMQVDLLRRWRASERSDRELFEALLASVNGIGRGLQSTG